MLNETLTSIKKIGLERAKSFAALGLFSFSDLIHFMPRDYHDFSKPKKISEAEDGKFAAFEILSIGTPKTIRLKSGITLSSVSFSDSTGYLQAVFYNQPYMLRSIPTKPGGYALGKVDKKHGAKLINPIFVDELPGIQPIYPLTHGLTQNVVRSSVRTAMTYCLHEVQDKLGEELCREFNLMGIHDALTNIHFPQDKTSLNAAKHRLAFESALNFTLILEIMRSERTANKGISFDIGSTLDEFKSLLPFAPTEAQIKVMFEIGQDMASSRPMNRLVQGDVGSGKTILALYAMFVAMKNGYQSVLMAPTEILAEQHFKLLNRLFGDKAALITRSLSAKKRNELLEDIRTGKCVMITGTHALIESRVEFHKLGVVITDEQHRFGVNQRAKLSGKSSAPDVMIMSATPIPRTLSLILYGDLDVSTVDGMPPGRKPVITRFVPCGKRIAMYRYIENEIRKNGSQAYVVCPMIEDNDTLANVNSAEAVFDELNQNLSVKSALLHGKLKSCEKDEIMTAFRQGKIDLLVSTTVIEVGVDIPNARIIVIESADRFGLAQLHQLRGRVGRGSDESYCFLLSSSDSGTAKERLNTLISTNDGFKIAEKDLELRGPGDFIGTRQSGIAGLGTAMLMSDLSTLIQARDAAIRIMSLNTDAAMNLKASAMDMYERLFKNIVIN